MDPVSYAERRRARRDGLAVPPSGDRHVQTGVARRETRDGLHQVAMPLHGKECTYGDDQLGAAGEPEFVPQRGACG